MQKKFFSKSKTLVNKTLNSSFSKNLRNSQVNAFNRDGIVGVGINGSANANANVNVNAKYKHKGKGNGNGYGNGKDSGNKKNTNKSRKSKNRNKSSLRSLLIEKRDESRLALKTTHKKASLWMDKQKFDLANLRRPAKLLAGASLTGSLLLSPPPKFQLTAYESKQKLSEVGFIGVDDLRNKMVVSLKPLIPNNVGHATVENEEKIQDIIESNFGIKAVAGLDGQKLNHSIGFMGKEHHLKRFPGDVVSLHDEEQSAGIAPGLGGWGYFKYSKDEMREEDYLKEKYYFAVQTLYLPNWQSDLTFLIKWYKHRKMIAINTLTGQAVVGVIADVGPANWTGKQFGGSPEVIKHLGLTYGRRKKKVILYFVDDKENKIPLGPVKENYKLQTASKV